MKIRAIVTGASGMVGEGVLMECLNSPNVEAVLVLGRRHCGITHPKLTEILHPNFYDITPIQSALTGYNACYFCLGVTSVGKNEEAYTQQTYTLTMHVATVLSNQNKDMVFCYVSGKGTNEHGKQMWARVKGKTESDLQKLPFKAVYAFRPGFMKATAGQQNTLKMYPYFAWLYPILKLLFPGSATTLAEVGQAMMNITQRGYTTTTIEVPDILTLAHAAS
jgi:hypothetical protein